MSRSQAFQSGRRETINVQPVAPPAPRQPHTPEESAAIQGNIDDVTSHLYRTFGSGGIDKVDLVKMPYRQTDKDALFQNHQFSGASIPPRGEAHILGDYVQRRFAVARVAGKHIPFYMSSGSAGKTTSSGGSTGGLWLPAMGIHHADEWINKAKGIENYYGSHHLAQIGHTIGQHFSNLSTPVPIVSGGPHISFINSAMKNAPVRMPPI